MLRKRLRIAAGFAAYAALLASIAGCTPPPPPPRAAFANQHRSADGEDEYDSWLWKRVTGKNKKQAEDDHAPCVQANGPTVGPPNGVNAAGNQPPAGWGGAPNQAGNMQPGVNPYQANPPQNHPNASPPQAGYQSGVAYGQPNYAPDRAFGPPNNTLPPGMAPSVAPSQPYPPPSYNSPNPQNLPPPNCYPGAAGSPNPAQIPNAANSGNMPANGYAVRQGATDLYRGAPGAITGNGYPAPPNGVPGPANPGQSAAPGYSFPANGYPPQPNVSSATANSMYSPGINSALPPQPAPGGPPTNAINNGWNPGWPAAPQTQ